MTWAESFGTCRSRFDKEQSWPEQEAAFPGMAFPPDYGWQCAGGRILLKTATISSSGSKWPRSSSAMRCSCPWATAPAAPSTPCQRPQDPGILCPQARHPAYGSGLRQIQQISPTESVSRKFRHPAFLAEAWPSISSAQLVRPVSEAVLVINPIHYAHRPAAAGRSAGARLLHPDRAGPRLALHAIRPLRPQAQ